MSPERTANFTQSTFPKPVSLGGRAVGWLEAEVQQWLQRRIEASRKVKEWVSARCALSDIHGVAVFSIRKCRPNYRLVKIHRNMS